MMSTLDKLGDESGDLQGDLSSLIISFSQGKQQEKNSPGCF